MKTTSISIPIATNKTWTRQDVEGASQVHTEPRAYNWRTDHIMEVIRL
jgi:hypothetical protein